VSKENKSRHLIIVEGDDESPAELYATLKAVNIHPLVAMCDGLPLTQFPKRKPLFIKVTEALKWHEAELEYSTDKDRRQEMINDIKYALAKFEQEEAKRNQPE